MGRPLQTMTVRPWELRVGDIVARPENRPGYRVMELDGIQGQGPRFPACFLRGRYPLSTGEEYETIPASEWLRILREAADA